MVTDAMKNRIMESIKRGESSDIVKKGYAAEPRPVAAVSSPISSPAVPIDLDEGTDSKTRRVLESIRAKKSGYASIPLTEEEEQTFEAKKSGESLPVQPNTAVVKSCTDASCIHWKDNDCTAKSIVLGPSHMCISYDGI